MYAKLLITESTRAPNRAGVDHTLFIAEFESQSGITMPTGIEMP